MNPLTGRLVKKIHTQEKFQIALFDYGGQIDTLFVFPMLDDEINFTLTKNSALANQKILRKQNLEELMTFAENLGALAVNVAHSGTVAGIFFHEDDLRVDEKISAVRKVFDTPKFLTLTRLVV